MLEELVIRTKLTPPRPRRHTLHRRRMATRLSEALDHRLTLLHAGTGYGKSTALADLTNQDAPLCWYSISQEDTDPFVFLLHLIYAFRQVLSGLPDAPLAVLERQSEQRSLVAWNAVADVLVNALLNALEHPTLLVLDDYHIVDEVTQIATIVDRVVGYAPDDLHVILSGRHSPSLPGLVVWRARGELLEIGHEDLAFTADEVAMLFQRQYSYQLSSAEVESLMAETEGWAIALQLIWQGLRSGAITNLTDHPAPRARRPSLEDLFKYLAQEVFDKQPGDIQRFLKTTSILRHLSPAACDAVRSARDSAALLTHLHDRDLFVVDLADGQSRYHHLFHDFLRGQLPTDRAQELHQRAADYYASIGDGAGAVYHLLTAGAYDGAAELLDEMGDGMVRQGRLDTLAGWIDRLPLEVLEEHPTLMTCLGDFARLRSQFDEALGWYTQAERHWRARGDRIGARRALQGQALVYLDTVRPTQAESLLTEALRLSEGQQDRQDRARLLELLAENKLNLGHPEEAEQLRAEARQWRVEGPSERQIGIRVLIRTGQLDRARVLLEAQAGDEENIEESAALGRAHQSHREVQLLLSLVYAFQGEAEAALKAARAGIAIGEKLNSPFVTAVGYMRLGHAFLIHPQHDAYLRAIECFKQAIALADAVAVRRTRVEAQWGLCRAYGFHGDLAAAEEAAALGIEIGRRAGDPWAVALIELTLGASYVLCGRPADAAKVLPGAIAVFRDCSDNYGRTAAHLWLGLAYLRLDQAERLAQTTHDLLALIETHGYDHLFTRQALLGPPDSRTLVPLLTEARRQRYRPGTADRLLNAMGLSDVELHPGYQLRVQTLGAFRVWRGREEVGAREWRRIKARHLFQLLLIHRGRMLQREEIVDTLWPDLNPDAIQRDFKVALNALNKALEPDRLPGAEPAYIARRDTSYGLRPGADVWLDADEFQSLIERGDRFQHDPEACADTYQRALDIYQGEYLPETLYEDWASEEREQLLTLYLRTAEKLAQVHLDQRCYDKAVDLCRRVLAIDNCWERAYQLLMVAYARQGNHPQALRTYETCAQTLRGELGVEPGAGTRQLRERLRNGELSRDWMA